MNDTKDIAEWAREQLEKMSRDPALAEAISKEELNAEIAQQIHNFRTQANLRGAFPKCRYAAEG
jgi:hypothetical protein